MNNQPQDDKLPAKESKSPYDNKGKRNISLPPIENRSSSANDSMEIYKSNKEMDLAMEDMNGSKSRMTDKSQKTLEVNGDVKIGSGLEINAYQDIQTKKIRKSFKVSVSPAAAPSRKNLQNGISSQEYQHLSVSTQQLKNPNLGPLPLNAVNERRSFNQDETDKILQKVRLQQKSDLKNVQSNSESFYLSNIPSALNHEIDKQNLNTDEYRAEQMEIYSNHSSDKAPKEEKLDEKQLERYKQFITAFQNKKQANAEEVMDHIQLDKLQAEDDDDGWDPNYKEGIFYINQMSCLECLRSCSNTDNAREMVYIYDYNSLYLFHSEKEFRKSLVKLIHHPVFENFIILCIAINTFNLAIYDYNDRDALLQRNKTLEYFNIVFTGIFTFELVIKVMAMGFVLHKNAYMRDPWNWLDFIVVIIGIVEFLPLFSLNTIKVLRVLRVLRPLRSIKSIPSMRRLIDSLLASIPTLANAVLFMFFIFLLFGILGVQQFQGVMYNRCRLTPEPLSDGTWPYLDTGFLCNKEVGNEYACPAETYCFSPQDAGLSRNIDEPQTQELIDYGIPVFDTLLTAMLTIFQMITLEGWSKIMYNLQNANMSWMAILFSISVVLFGAFLLLNVILAVLAEALQEADAIDAAKQDKILLELNKSVKRQQKQKGEEVTGFVEKSAQEKKRKTQMINQQKAKEIEIAIDKGTGNSASAIISESSSGNQGKQSSNNEVIIKNEQDNSLIHTINNDQSEMQILDQGEDPYYLRTIHSRPETIEDIQGRKNSTIQHESRLTIPYQENTIPNASNEYGLNMKTQKIQNVSRPFESIHIDSQLSMDEQSEVNSNQMELSEHERKKRLRKRLSNRNSREGSSVDAASNANMRQITLSRDIRNSRDIKTPNESIRGAFDLKSQNSLHSRASSLGRTLEEKRLDKAYAALDRRQSTRMSTINSSITVDTIPERAKNNCLYKICYKIQSHYLFTLVITLLIFVNTGVLASDRYPEDQDFVKEFELANTIFTYCFLAEMIIKLLGLGVKDYTRDGFNRFDAAIVILSMVEIALQGDGQSNNISTGGAFSAFRGVRLLRVFKLARSWTSFKNLLKVMIETIKDVQTFGVLLVICMLILALLGMELFGHKVKYDMYDNALKNPKEYEGDTLSPRVNFDNIGMSMLAIFVMFIGEDWNNVMYKHERVIGLLCQVVFPVFLVILNWILLNLFLAILLRNFDKILETDDLDAEDTDASAFRKLEKTIKAYYASICGKKVKTQGISALDSTPNVVGIKGSKQMIKAHTVEHIQDHLQPQERSLFRASSKIASEFQIGEQILGEGKNEPIDSQDLSNSDESNSSSSIQMSSPSVNVDSQARVVSESAPGDEQDGGISKIEMAQVSKAKQQHESPEPNRRVNGSPMLLGLNTLKEPNTADKNIDDFPQPKLSNQRSSINFQRALSSFSNAQDAPTKKQRRRTIVLQQQKLLLNSTYVSSTAQLKKLELEEGAGKKQKKNIVVEGRSLGCLSPENTLRQLCHKIVAYEHYDNIILSLIILSTILLTFDNPLDPQVSLQKTVLKVLDYVMASLFTLEFTINVILYGFIVNGKHSYMRDGWNVMDFLIVVFSLFSIAMDIAFAGSQVDLGFLRVFRLLRVLRPLRMLKRNQGLRIQVLSLMNAIPNISNLILIMLLVLMLFGIQGVTFFKGKFYYCHQENLPEQIQEKIVTMWDCYDAGGEWVKYHQNFDNVGEAMVTMFNLMTSEGWIEVMWHAVDTTEIHLAPKEFNSPHFIIFFILFLIFGALFILNAFVGVVISVFNDEKSKLTRENYLTDTQKEYIECLLKSYGSKPTKKIQAKGNKFQQFIFDFVHYKDWFNNFILVCILLNTVCLALSWYGQPEDWISILNKFNLFFTFIYTFEFVIKLVALGGAYFSEGWNVFDFIIVVSAWAGIIALQIFNIDVGAVSTIIRSFRIARIIKIIKRLKELQKIINTFIVAIPELANVGGLLVLFIYLYSILGVFLFAEVRFGDSLNVHANFRNFPNAALTLFRIVTGEAWNEIMKDTSVQRSILTPCVQTQTWEEQQDQINGCGDPYGSLLFYMSYMLIVQFVLLNLFLAIILDGWDKTKMELDLKINDEHILAFTQAWQRYDKHATGLIDVDKLDNLLIDLCFHELKLIKDDGIKDSEDVLFNLHKLKRVVVNHHLQLVNWYTKLEISEGTHELHEEDEKIKNEVIDQNDLCFKDFGGRARLQRILTRGMNKLIGEFKIPTYNGLKKYNYHDTLDALIKLVFTDDHRRIYLERKERIEQTLNAGLELRDFDMIQQGSEEFNDLPLLDQEFWLEVNDEYFDPTIGRLEGKARDTTNPIAKLVHMQKLRRQCGKQYRDQLDMFNEQPIDSSVIRGALTIQKFIQQKKHRIRVGKAQGKLGKGFLQFIERKQKEMAIEEQKSKKEYVDEIEDDLKHLTMPKQNLLKIEMVPMQPLPNRIGPLVPLNNMQKEQKTTLRQQNESSIAEFSETNQDQASPLRKIVHKNAYGTKSNSQRASLSQKSESLARRRSMSRSEQDSQSSPSNKRQKVESSAQDKLPRVPMQQIHIIQDSIQQNVLTSMTERVGQGSKEVQSTHKNVLKLTTNNSKIGVTSRINTENELVTEQDKVITEVFVDSAHFFEEGDEGGGEPVAQDIQSIEDHKNMNYPNVNYVPIDTSAPLNTKIIDDTYTATQQVNGLKGEPNYLRQPSLKDDSNKGSEAVPSITKRTYKAKQEKIYTKMNNADPKYQLSGDKKLNMVIIDSHPQSNPSSAEFRSKKGQQVSNVNANLKTLKISTEKITTETFTQKKDFETTAFENSIKMSYNRLRKNKRGGPSDDNGGGRKDQQARFGSRNRGPSTGELGKEQNREGSQLRLQEIGQNLVMQGATKMNSKGKREVLANVYLDKK